MQLMQHLSKHLRPSLLSPIVSFTAAQSRHNPTHAASRARASMHPAPCMSNPRPRPFSSVSHRTTQGQQGAPVSWRIASMSSTTVPATNTHASTPAILRLHQAAERHLAHGSRLTPAQVQELRELAGAVTLSEMGFQASILQDAGLVTSQLEQQDKRHPFLKGHVTYLHIHDSPQYSMGIFMLPAGSSIPLHNHPGMTVISNLLFGSMHLKAYDPLPDPPTWTPPTHPSTTPSTAGNSLDRLSDLGEALPAGAAPLPGPRTWGQRMSNMAANIRHQLLGPQPVSQEAAEHLLSARLTVNETVTAPTGALVLYPDSCNIHEFTALTNCAVLDLLAPPYNEDDGRDCTYFQEVETQLGGEVEAGGSAARRRRVGDMVLLEPVHSDFFTKSAQYQGIPIE